MCSVLPPSRLPWQGSCVSSARCAREVHGRWQSHKAQWLVQCSLDHLGILVDHMNVLTSLN